MTTTEDHPFWNHTDQQWQAATDLDTGDQLLTANGTTITVAGLDSDTATEGTAYNLTVDRLHTYHVVVGDAEVLVHNTCGAEVPSQSRAVIDSIKNDGVISQSGVHGPSVPERFMNDGRSGSQILPREGPDGTPVSYREWGTVPDPGNPTPGSERIVTGSDGSVWYTPDHYKSFVEVK